MSPISGGHANPRERLHALRPYVIAAFLLAGSLLSVAGMAAHAPWKAPEPTLAAVPTSPSPAALEMVGQLGGRAWDMRAQGNYLYVGQGAGLSVMDTTEPAAPRRVGWLGMPGIVKRVDVAGGYAYAAVEDAQYTRLLKVVSLADPARPQEVGSFVLGYDYGLGYAGIEMAVAGDQVYVADRNGLRVISVADRANPRQVAWYDLRGTPHAITAAGRYAYVVVAVYEDYQYQYLFLLEILDMADPAAPQEVGSLALTGRPGSVAVSGEYAYVGFPSGVQVFDVADKARPRLLGGAVGDCPPTGPCWGGMAVAGDYAYMGFSNQLQVISLADKGMPQVVGALAMSDTGPLALAGDYVYVAGWSGNLLAFAVADRARPQQVGSYPGPPAVGQVFVAGDYAYTAYYGRLYTVLVADRTRPQIVSSLPVSGQITSLFVAGDFAYTLAQTTGIEGFDVGAFGLRIFSLADKAHPVQVGAYLGETGERLVGGKIFVSGDYAYALASGGLWVISVADRANPRRVGFYPVGYEYYANTGLYVAGDHAYLGGPGLRVISVADKASPQQLGTVPGRGGVYEGSSGVFVAGEYAYVADGSAGLRIISLADKSNPREVASYDTPGEGRGVSLAGDVAYVDDGRAGLRAISVADPARPQELASYPSLYGASGAQMAVHASGDYAYVANGEAGLLVFRLRYGAAPAPLATRPAPRVPAELVGHIGGQSKAVASDSRYIYAGEGSSLSVLDVSDPARPRRLGSVAVPAIVENVALAGDYAYVAAGTAGLRVISVADKARPTEVGVFYRPAGDGTFLDVRDVAVARPYAYMASYEGVNVLSLADPTQPLELATYKTATAASELAISDGYLYVSPGGEVFSLADPARPTLVGAPFELGGLHMAVAGDYAYIPDAPLKVVSVANRSAPRVVYRGADTDCAHSLSNANIYSGGLAISGSYLYLICEGSGKSLKVFSIANPASPAEVGSLALPDNAFGLVLAGDHLFVASYERGLRAISVADPARPVEAGAYDPVGAVFLVAAQGDYAYVADPWGGLRVISVADKARPVPVGAYASPQPETIGDLAVSGGYAYLTVEDPGRLRVISVIDPARPTLTGVYTVPVQQFNVAQTWRRPAATSIWPL